MPRLRSALAACLAVAAAGAPVAAAADVTPAEPAVTFRALASGFTGKATTVPDGTAALVVGGPDRFAVRGAHRAAPLFPLVRNRGLETSADGAGSRVRRTFAAAPDGYTVWDRVSPSLDTLLADARADRTLLGPGRVHGTATLQGAVPLPVNDCAGLRAGFAIIDLDARTLLPVRVRTLRSGSRAQTFSLRYRAVNRAPAPSAFRPAGPLGRGAFRDDQGFRRVSPAAAAAHLPYAPELPAAVPDGFRLAVSGWAPRSGITGAEGSIPPRRALFAAVYARGWERIELTQRAAGGAPWPGDPFGAECRPVTERAVTVGGLPATFAEGAEVRPHLYWREGAVLHTVSGPFPAETLVAVAESLTPVAAR